MRQRDPRQVDEKHCAFIRLLPCIITLGRPVDCAHIRFASAAYGKRQTGMGERPSDCWTLPLSRPEHVRQHSMLEADYWKGHAIDPIEVARALYDVSGDLQAGEEIVRRYAKALRW